MAKTRTRFVCSDCGHVTGQWVGQCPSCKAWNTVTEFKEHANPRMERAATAAGMAEARPLRDYTEQKSVRVGTGEGEFDRVLGGGLVPGALVLLGGEPGIGKSDIEPTDCHEGGRQGAVRLGEESPEQVRLGPTASARSEANLLILPETSTEGIVKAVKAHEPDLLFVDSIQTLHTPRVESAPGSVAQVRESTAELILAAKPLQLPVVLIGHITKEGAIAGPKVLEHMVDVVLTFEGDRHHAYRILRAVKNRFGSTQEIGIFEMRGDGLHPVTDPSGALVGDGGSPTQWNGPRGRHRRRPTAHSGNPGARQQRGVRDAPAFRHGLQPPPAQHATCRARKALRIQARRLRRLPQPRRRHPPRGSRVWTWLWSAPS